MNGRPGGNALPYRVSKRLFDIAASGLGIVITFPLWLAAVAGIEMSDPGPVFYMADRVGMGNASFRMFKFRSMRVDDKADEKSFKADTGRIFRWGQIMRDLKIDELPQLLNVFMGDMSIVGPRPAAKDQLDTVRAGKYSLASTVKPGLTGPAALYDYIYGDTITDEAEYEEKVLPTRMELDVYYVGHMGVFYDMKMILWTVRCIFGSLIKCRPKKLLDNLVGCVSIADKAVIRFGNLDRG